MCISASASFAVSGALVAGGIAVARLPKPRVTIPLSLFPLIFGLHQFIEGLVWLTYGGFLDDMFRPASVYAYVLIAFVFWPVFVPFSVYMMESGRIRKKLISMCLAAGLFAGLWNLGLIIRGPVDATVTGHSIAYSIYAPDIISAFYMGSIFLPFFISGNRRMLILGIALAVSLGISSAAAASTTFPSVWCFSAAVLSLFLFIFFKFPARETAELPVIHSSS